MGLNTTKTFGNADAGSSVTFKYSAAMQDLILGSLLSEAETLAIMADAAKLVFDEAQQFVIVDKGALRASGRLEGTRNDAGQPRTIMRWGNSDVRYANKQYLDMGISVISAGNSKGRKEWGIYAYTLNRGKYEDRLADNLKKLLDRKGLKTK